MIDVSRINPLQYLTDEIGAALLVGGSPLAIGGALLAVPTAAGIQVIFEEGTADAPRERSKV